MTSFKVVCMFIPWHRSGHAKFETPDPLSDALEPRISSVLTTGPCKVRIYASETRLAFHTIMFRQIPRVIT